MRRFESEFALQLLKQNSNCQPQMLSTTVRLAPTTHLEERSLPSGDELAENLLVSKSRIAQIVPSVQPAIRRQAQIDAVVVGQVLRLL
jgi:hypothetical protein